MQDSERNSGRLNPINPKKTFTEERIAKYIRIIQKADPTIRNISVSTSEEEIARQKIDTDDFENREIIAKKMTVSIDTKHAVLPLRQENHSCDQSIEMPPLWACYPAEMRYVLWGRINM